MTQKETMTTVKYVIATTKKEISERNTNNQKIKFRPILFWVEPSRMLPMTMHEGASLL